MHGKTTSMLASALADVLQGRGVTVLFHAPEMFPYAVGLLEKMPGFEHLRPAKRHRVEFDALDGRGRLRLATPGESDIVREHAYRVVGSDDVVYVDHYVWDHR